MAHGSIVTNSSQAPSRWLPTFRPASRRATISACAVGSWSVRLRFHPRPTTRSSHTTTAPTGTSSACKARWAQRRASSIQSSSDDIWFAVRSSEASRVGPQWRVAGSLVLSCPGEYAPADWSLYFNGCMVTFGVGNLVPIPGGQFCAPLEGFGIEVYYVYVN